MSLVRGLRVSMAAIVGVAGVVLGGVAPAPVAFAAVSPQISLTPNGPTGSLRFKGGATRTVTVMLLTTEQLTLSTRDGSFATNCGLQVSLLAPDSSVLSGPTCAGKSGSIAISAPVDGEYTASFSAATKGAVTVAATSDGGPTSITPGAEAVSVQLLPSSHTDLGFTALAGESFSTKQRGQGRHGCRDVTIEFVDSDANVLSSGCDGFLDETTLPADGVYFVRLVASAQLRVPETTVQLYRDVDQTGTIPTGGVDVPVSITTPGQNARFTFKGNVGSRIAAVLTDSTFHQCALTLRRPDGSVAASTPAGCGTSSSYVGFLEPFRIDQVGTWTLVVDPTGPVVGSATVQRYTDVDQTGTAALDGTPVSIDLTQPGQQARYSFSGTTGQEISASLDAATFPAQCPPAIAGYSFALVRPDGSIKAGGFNCSSDGVVPTSYLDASVLDATGTWSVVIDPVAAVTGSATLRVFGVVDQTGSADLAGPPVDLTLSVPGQNARLSFSATTGQHVSVALSSSTFASPCTMSVLRPDASVFETGSCASPGGFLEATALDATGTWTVVVDPQGPTTGTGELQVANVVDQTGTITPGGSNVGIDVTVPGQNATFTFSGATGDHRTVSVTDSTFSGCSAIFVSVLRPNGTRLSIKGTCNATLTLGPVTLDATGTWTILVDPQGPTTGTATMSLT